MTLRQIKKALRTGVWMMEPGERVTARSEFQRQRLTAAVTAARLYLEENVEVAAIGKSLGVTGERAAQIVRLGISWMKEAGWLRPTAP